MPVVCLIFQPTNKGATLSARIVEMMKSLCAICLLLVCSQFGFAQNNATKHVSVNTHVQIHQSSSVFDLEPSYLNSEGRRFLRTGNVEQTKLQRCKDAGEAYSASYLITKEHLLEQFTDYNLTWVNCEMGTFIFMNGRANPTKDINGSIMQSVDLLDFSVIHLSTYERLLKRWRFSIKSEDATKGNIEPVRLSAEMLQQRALKLRSPTVPTRYDKFNRTVVIMPFLGTDMGAGHSKLSNRFQYLAACFWSFYADYPYIVVAVKSDKDRYFARNVSGLPFYDVMLLENLPKSASLPVATSQETKRRIQSGFWDFDYIFYTESDQILMNRAPEDQYEYLDAHPRHVMIPHRLMAYPNDIITMFHKRETNKNGPYDWMDMQCCMARQHCTDRKDWKHISDAAVRIVNIFGIQTALGNADFHRESYRTCALNEMGDLERCP